MPCHHSLSLSLSLSLSRKIFQEVPGEVENPVKDQNGSSGYISYSLNSLGRGYLGDCIADDYRSHSGGYLEFKLYISVYIMDYLRKASTR